MQAIASDAMHSVFFTIPGNIAMTAVSSGVLVLDTTASMAQVTFNPVTFLIAVVVGSIFAMLTHKGFSLMIEEEAAKSEASQKKWMRHFMFGIGSFTWGALPSIVAVIFNTVFGSPFSGFRAGCMLTNASMQGYDLICKV
ncbi:MAG: hypothetical protein H0X51_10015 [Parachlamydiaceae bacterium]|nr:hypothetical protein [Parachlamydiaceae bacterium]